MKFLTTTPETFTHQLAKNPWLDKIGQFNQDHIMTQFINQNKIESCVAVNSELWNQIYSNVKLQDIVDPPELLIFTVNDRIEIDDLIAQIKMLISYTNNFLYTPINKYKIYSDVNRNSSDEYDNNLVQYYLKGLEDYFTPVSLFLTPDDRGLIGNFIHPATQLFLKKC